MCYSFLLVKWWTSRQMHLNSFEVYGISTEFSHPIREHIASANLRMCVLTMAEKSTVYSAEKVFVFSVGVCENRMLPTTNMRLDDDVGSECDCVIVEVVCSVTHFHPPHDAREILSREYFATLSVWPTKGVLKKWKSHCTRRVSWRIEKIHTFRTLYVDSIFILCGDWLLASFIHIFADIAGQKCKNTSFVCTERFENMFSTSTHYRIHTSQFDR